MKRFLCLAGVSVLLSGCFGTSKYMVDSSEDEFQKVRTGDQAQLIMMRVSSFGGAIDAPVFDVSQGEPKLLGVSTPQTKIAVPLKPGKHTFMVIGEAADFMEINAAPGKTYYALVEPRMGVWKARFTLQPIKKEGACNNNATFDGGKISAWLKESRYVVLQQEAGNAWYASNANSVKEKQAEYWSKWDGKNDKACYIAKETDGE